MTTTTRKVNIPQNYETVAWKWMRYSGVLLVPLVWIHVAIKDVIHGVHAIDFDYVMLHWANIGWQTYDILLLAFTFAHGMNGLRQVLMDYVTTDKARKNLSRGLFALWIVVSAIGATAILFAAKKNLAG
ncbi:MAG: hypothetical protein N2D54_03540 [Chloroflexota bacterium]